LSLQNKHSEKYDLYKLIHSLNSNELRKVRSYLNSSENKKSRIYKELFERIKRQSEFNEQELKKEFKLSNEKFRDIKFYLIRFILDCLKKIDPGKAKIKFYKDIIELRILTGKGLFRKASRKLKFLKERAIVRHDFALICDLLRFSESLTMFEASEDELIQKTLEVKKEINYYLDLAKNLNEYSALTIEILGLGYKMSDSRLEQNSILLNFLNHPLLENESKAKSDLAKYIYFEAKCLLYMGVNNYENASIYALKGWNHVIEIHSPYRNDNHLILTSLSNYLHAVLRISDIEAYNNMVPQFEEIVETQLKDSTLRQKAKTFAMHSSVKLTYFSNTNKYADFIQMYPELNENFIRYKNIIHPNFKANIMYFIARLFFIGGSLEKSLEWSNKLQDLQRLNPYYMVLVCNNILRIMIHYELGNLITIPYLSNNATYFIKSKNRYFELERCFIKGISKVKAFHTKKQKQVIIKTLFHDLEVLVKDNDNKLINGMVGITDWLESKIVKT